MSNGATTGGAARECATAGAGELRRSKCQLTCSGEGHESARQAKAATLLGFAKQL